MTPLRILRWAWKVLALVVLGVFVYLLVSVVQVLGASEVPQVPSAVAPAAAVVVMTPAGSSSKLTADDTARLDQAVTLFDGHRAPVVVVTGPDGSLGVVVAVTPANLPSAATEVGAEVRYLERQGVGQGKIELAGGTDDSSALEGVARLVGHADGGRVIIVSDPLSSLRLRATAAAKGLVPEISPATPPAASFWSDVGQVWHQASTVAMGRVLGF